MADRQTTGAAHIAALCCEHGLHVTPQELVLIVAGASGRLVMRVCPAGVPCGIIGIYWTPERADNQSFVEAASGLRQCGVPVPRLLRYRALPGGCGVCLVQDLGNCDLLSLKNAAAPLRLAAYRSALQGMHALHSVSVSWPLQPPFDADLYRWEQSYFAEHFLGHHLGGGTASTAYLTLAAPVAEWLGALPRVPVHRDFQSQNIMLYADKAYLIDFQGMRMGRAEYDLASLVLDPYMALPEHEVQALLAHYTAISAMPLDADVFAACALQRLMQALGAFANIGYNQKRDWYLNMIEPGVRALRYAAASVRAESPAYSLAQWLLNLA
ncbi:MAG: hypothetical protein E7033_01130 [Akkermansiaceae bacterium]|nr:hypothetical protein [Akkermansiaceae bacterium]